METLNPLFSLKTLKTKTKMNKLWTFKSLTKTKPTYFHYNIKTSFKCSSTILQQQNLLQNEKQPSIITTTLPQTTILILPEKNLVEKKPTKKKSSNVLLSKKDIAAQFKQNWLNSISSPNNNNNNSKNDNGWVIGVDPDVSGAIALLKPEHRNFSAQVFDSPSVKILIGNRSRRRLDANSIVQLLRSFDAPVGTTAYLEQSIPFPRDGKQGWWSGGFGYGLWIGVLVASGFSVIPVPSLTWKNKFCLSGSRTSKDDSRELASTLFPNMCSLLKRKKDHGRAEALLIAAYGKGLNLSTDLSGISEDLTLQHKID